MNYYIEKTTSNERMVISNALDGVFIDLERAKNLLYTVYDDYFNNLEQKALTPLQASWVRDMLAIVNDILCDSVLAYHLTVANVENPMAKVYLDSLERVKVAASCEQAHDSLLEKECFMPPERRKVAIEARNRIRNMEDKAAIKGLESLAKEVCREEISA